jgi:hypothetical protein
LAGFSGNHTNHYTTKATQDRVGEELAAEFNERFNINASDKFLQSKPPSEKGVMFLHATHYRTGEQCFSVLISQHNFT